MKFVTREELRACPEGTIFYEYHPKAPCSIQLMRFDGNLRGDFLESTVGPYWTSGGYSKDTPYDHHAINTHNGREGMFDDSIVYVVLEPADVEAMIKQLKGEDVEVPPLRLM